MKTSYIFSSDTLNIHLRLLSKNRIVNNNKEEQREEHEQEKQKAIFKCLVSL